MAILPENEYTTFENRDYINPEVSLNEQMSFIDNLRDTQKQNNAQIRQQTYNLGTSVPSNLGGLVGGEGYWTSRYQTPQTNSLASELRSTAQAQALNDVLSNEQAKWKKRYNDAYNANQRRNANKTNGGDGETGETEGGIETDDNSGMSTAEYDISTENGDVVVRYKNEYGEYTGKEKVFHQDGSSEDRDTDYSHDLGRAAGMSEFSDLFTGKYNYTFDGVEIEEGGTDEEVVVGPDGRHSIWNKNYGTYTPITGNSGSTRGGGRWWTQ